MIGRIALGSLLAVASVLAAPAAAQYDDRWVEFANQTATRLALAPAQVSNATTEIDFAWGDFDKDGWIDLAVARKEPWSTPGKRTNILLMNVNGVLTDRTAQKAVASDVAGDFGFLTPTNDRDVIATDVDRDGWIDVVTATALSFGDPKHVSHPRVYRNRRNAGATWQGLRFENARIPQLVAQVPTGANSCAVAAGDVTGDDAPELFFVDYDVGGGHGVNDLGHRLLVNDGNGFFADETFARMTPIMIDSSFGTSGVIADLNGDGVQDVATTEDGPVEVRYNAPANEGFFNLFQTAYTSFAYFISAGDLNDDGRLDLAVTDDSQDYCLYNRGNDPLGRVSWAPPLVLDFVSGFDQARGGDSIVRDLDRDGWNDVIITDVDTDVPGCNGRTYVFHNPGGAPGSEPLPIEERESDEAGAWIGAVGFKDADLRGAHDVAVFDVDRDGAEDVVLGRCTGTFVWINQTDCQADLGGQGNGPARMSVCGGALASGSDATMVVGPLPLSSVVLVLGSLASFPAHAWEVQSTLFPVPPLFVIAVPTPATSATLRIPVPGGGGPASLFVQWLVPGPSLPTPSGWYATNAVRLDFLP